jgi:hypothetical protein
MAGPDYNAEMEATAQTDRERGLELARKAFRDFYAQCFWSADPNLVVEAQHIPFIIRNLRLHGGHKGFRLAAAICRWAISSAK